MALPTSFLPSSDRPLKVLSLFSGIGAFERALQNLGIPFQLINYCEIDKNAAHAYSILHGVPESLNLRDVTTVDTSLLPSDLDLITYGFPCQDISLAGKKRGLFREDGSLTRSGLFFEALRIIHDTQPAIAIAENVKNLTGDGFKEQFETVLSSLFEAGYNSYFAVLNAKDFGVPQNRERVFIVSVRKDIPYIFHAPEGFPLTLCLRDVLESNVPDRFYLSDAMIRNISGFGPTPYPMNPEIDKDIAHTFTATMHKMHRANSDTYVSDSFANSGTRVSIKNGYPELYTPPSPNASLQQTFQLYPSSGDIPNKIKQVGQLVPGAKFDNPERGRVYDSSGLSPTLNTVSGGGLQPKITEVKQIGNTVYRPTFDNPQEGRVYSPSGPSPTLTRHKNNVPKIPVHEGTAVGYAFAEEGDSVNYERVSDPNRRDRVGKGVANIILAESSMGVVTPSTSDSSPLRIRHLTPGECFRLMGFTTEDSALLSSHGISNTQLYHMAGNSIVVDVLMAIFKEVYL